MGVEQKDENLEIITTYNWDTDTKAFEDKSIETQSTLIILAT